MYRRLGRICTIGTCTKRAVIEESATVRLKVGWGGGGVGPSGSAPDENSYFPSSIAQHQHMKLARNKLQCIQFAELAHFPQLCNDLAMYMINHVDH